MFHRLPERMVTLLLKNISERKLEVSGPADEWLQQFSLPVREKYIHSLVQLTKAKLRNEPYAYYLSACEYQHVFLILPALRPELQAPCIPPLPTQT